MPGNLILGDVAHSRTAEFGGYCPLKNLAGKRKRENKFFPLSTKDFALMELFHFDFLFQFNNVKF